MQLRDYQQWAVDECWKWISNNDGNPCIVLPTGAGKSVVLAQLAKDAVEKWDGRVCILAHVKELVEQNADKLRSLAPGLDIGVYSAGLRKRDRHCKVLVAGIQSVYNKADHFDPFDVIIVDEAHMLPPDGEGMYRTFLRDCKIIRPHVRLIGLTATPYRMTTGWVCGPDNLLNEICVDIGIRPLIEEGYLSNIVSKEPIRVDTSSLHLRGGEFVAEEAESLIGEVIGPACEEIVKRTADRHSVLVFCQSVQHMVAVAMRLGQLTGEEVRHVDGNTTATERSEILERFKGRQFRYLVNVNVLTTGFDAPNIDCVCLLRPTMSPGLYYQMVGRGFRLFPGKTECLVLDFAGNVRQHGPVDQIEPKPKSVNDGGGEAPTKTCPDCESIIHAAYSECPDCGHIFPAPIAKHAPAADVAPVLSGQKVTEEFPCQDVRYSVHKGREGKPNSMRVDYKLNLIRWESEWVCVAHEGFAQDKARRWWRERSNDPFPETAEDAVEMAKAGALAVPLVVKVTTTAGEKYPKVSTTVGPKPERHEHTDGEDIDFAALAGNQDGNQGGNQETAVSEAKQWIDEKILTWGADAPW